MIRTHYDSGYFYFRSQVFSRFLRFVPGLFVCDKNRVWTYFLVTFAKNMRDYRNFAASAEHCKWVHKSVKQSPQMDLQICKTVTRNRFTDL